MSRYAVVGFARTGKDTFYADVANGELELVTSTEEAKWAVYVRPGATLLPLSGLLAAKTHERFAHADTLKAATHHYLGLRDCPAHAFDAVKESMQLPDPVTKKLKTIRGHYIDYGQLMRADNPSVWSDHVTTATTEWCARNPFGAAMITDWRFENELKDDMTTIRLWREAVIEAQPVGDLKIDSEHNLDHVQTDFLLVPPGEAAQAAKRFPQYVGYVPRAYLVAKKRTRSASSTQ